MQTYTVHEAPDSPSDRVERAERLAFVKEGFSWPAAVAAPIWLAVHRIWLPLAAYLAIVGGVEALKYVTALDHRWLGLVVVGLNLAVAYEADTLRRWALDRRGWRDLGAVSGRNLAECERRFFDGWLPAQPILARPAARP